MTKSETPKSEGMTKPEKLKERLIPSRYLGVSLFGLLLGLWVLRHSGFPLGANECEATGRIVQAGAEEFIWIVVGIFWVIAQIAGGAAKKKMNPRLATEEENGGEAPVDPFAELMRKLVGVQEINAPAPPKPVEIPIKAARSERFAPPETSKPIDEATPPAEPNRAGPVTQVAEVDIRPTMNAFKTAMPSMKFPSMSLNFQGSEKSTGNAPILGNIINPSDKSTLRRAMLGHIILGKPRGMGEWNRGILE